MSINIQNARTEREYKIKVAGFRNLKRDLLPLLRQRAGLLDATYTLLMAVISGRRTTGPVAQDMMSAIAELTGSSITELWPESETVDDPEVPHA